MRVLVCGSRDWIDVDTIKAELVAVGATHVIHGGARGADTCAGRAALQLGLPMTVFKADWKTYGKRAGYLRNVQMADEGKPEFLLAFKSQPVSVGTDHMIAIAKERGLHGNVWVAR